MRETFYPSLEEALYLHSELIRRFGGSPGVRDVGLLESALYRPRSGYYKTVFEQAAALLHSLARNHVFVDGNKRMAFALATVFLRLNDIRITVAVDDAESFIVGRVIKSHAEIIEIADWLAEKVKQE